jgi:hypothetical protein
MPPSIAKTAGSLNQHNILYEKDIKRMLRTGMVTEGYMTPKVCENKWSSPNVKGASIVQPYQWKFTASKNQHQFDAVESTLQPLKIDIRYTAEELEEFHNSWMVEWYELGKDMMEWSFPKWLWEKVLVKDYENDMEMKIVFGGQYSKPTSGVAGMTMNSCDGLGVSLLQGIYKGDCVPFQMGEMQVGDEVAYLEDFCNRFPSEYKNVKMPIYCDPAIPRAFYFNRRDRFSRDTNYTAGLEMPIETFNKTLVPLPSMAGTGLFFATPQANLVKGFKKGTNPNPVIRWYPDEAGRALIGAAEFWRFYNVAFYQEVFLPDTFLKLPNMLPVLPQAA